MRNIIVNKLVQGLKVYKLYKKKIPDNQHNAATYTSQYSKRIIKHQNSRDHTINATTISKQKKIVCENRRVSQRPELHQIPKIPAHKNEGNYSGYHLLKFR